MSNSTPTLVNALTQSSGSFIDTGFEFVVGPGGRAVYAKATIVPDAGGDSTYVTADLFEDGAWTPLVLPFSQGPLDLRALRIDMLSEDILAFAWIEGQGDAAIARLTLFDLADSAHTFDVALQPPEAGGRLLDIDLAVSPSGTFALGMVWEYADGDSVYVSVQELSPTDFSTVGSHHIAADVDGSSESRDIYRAGDAFEIAFIDDDRLHLAVSSNNSGVERYQVDLSTGGVSAYGSVLATAFGDDNDVQPRMVAGDSGWTMHIAGDNGLLVLARYNVATGARGEGPILLDMPFGAETLAHADIVAVPGLPGGIDGFMLALWGPGMDHVELRQYATAGIQIGDALNIPLATDETITELEFANTAGGLALSWMSEGAGGDSNTFLAEVAPITVTANEVYSSAGEVVAYTDGANVNDMRGGDDAVYGGAGPEWFFANLGTDTFDGGAGFDTVDIHGSLVATFVFNIDLGLGTDQHGNEYVSIERIIGGSLDDTLKAGAAGVEFHGMEGNDLLIDGAGSDRLFGGVDDDEVRLGAGGFDYADGGQGDDTLVFVAAVQGNGRYHRNFETVIGSGAGDVFSQMGDFGAYSVRAFGGRISLQGGGGGDIFIAGAAQEDFDGGSGSDTVSYILSDAGISLSQLGDVTGGFAAGDTLTGIETLIATSFDDVFASGFAFSGGISAGAGQDTYFADSVGVHKFFGGADVDTLDLGNIGFGVVTGLQAGGFATSGDISGFKEVERIVGTSFADTLTLALEGGELDGGGGDDTFIAAILQGSYLGGAGIDTLDLSALAGQLTSGQFAAYAPGVERLRATDADDFIDIGYFMDLDGLVAFDEISMLGGVDRLRISYGDGPAGAAIDMGAGEDLLEITLVGLDAFPQDWENESLDGGADRDVLSVSFHAPVDGGLHLGAGIVGFEQLDLAPKSELEYEIRDLDVAAGRLRFDTINRAGGDEAAGVDYRMAWNTALGDPLDLRLTSFLGFEAQDSVIVELTEGEVFTAEGIRTRVLLLDANAPALIHAGRSDVSAEGDVSHAVFSYAQASAGVYVNDSGGADGVFTTFFLDDFTETTNDYAARGVLETSEFGDVIQSGGGGWSEIRMRGGADQLLFYGDVAGETVDMGAGADTLSFHDLNGASVYTADLSLDGGADHDVVQLNANVGEDILYDLTGASFTNFEELKFFGGGDIRVAMTAAQVRQFYGALNIAEGMSVSFTVTRLDPAVYFVDFDAFLEGVDPETQVDISFVTGAESIISVGSDRGEIFVLGVEGEGDPFETQHVASGAGDELIIVQDGRAKINAGDDHDTVRFGHGVNIVRRSGQLEVVGGEHGGSSVKNAERLELSDEDDVVSLAQEVGFLQTGGGRDFVSLIGTGPFNVELGTGEDQVELTNLADFSQVSLHGGANGDILRIQTYALPGYEALDLRAANLSGFERLEIELLAGKNIQVLLTEAQAEMLSEFYVAAPDEPGLVRARLRVVGETGDIDLSGLRAYHDIANGAQLTLEVETGDAAPVDVRYAAYGRFDFVSTLGADNDGGVTAYAGDADGGHVAGDSLVDTLVTQTIGDLTPVLFSPSSGTPLVLIPVETVQEDGDLGLRFAMQQLSGFEQVTFSDGETVTLSDISRVSGGEQDVQSFVMRGLGDNRLGLPGLEVTTLEGQDPALGEIDVTDETGAVIGTVRLEPAGTDSGGGFFVAIGSQFPSVVFTPAAGAFDYLQAGESAEITVSGRVGNIDPDDPSFSAPFAATFVVEGEDDAPVFTDASFDFQIAENQTMVAEIGVEDPDDAFFTLAISGGADGALFRIAADGRTLEFIDAPDYESRGDADGDNIYDVELTLFDTAGNSTRTAHVEVTDVPEAPVIGEVRQLTLTDSWMSLDFDNTYVDPVVFALAPSLNEFEAVATRLRNITSDGAEIRLQEVLRHLGTPVFDSHAAEDVTLLVLEKGVHVLADGTVLEVGETITNKLYVKGFEEVSFSAPFSETPSIFSQVQTFAGTDWIISRQHQPDADGFLMTMQEEEFDNVNHAHETVGWLAIERGATEWSGLAFQAGTSDPVKVNQNATFVPFLESFEEAPNVVVSMATYVGTDPSSPRIASVTQNGFSALVLEDTSLNEEIFHGLELLDWMAFGGEGDLHGSPLLVSASLSAPAASVSASAAAEAVLEAGTAFVNDKGIRVAFGAEFDAPLVFVTVTTTNGTQEVIARVSDVDAAGFSLRLQEADGLDGFHAWEEVSWVAVEAGDWALQNGATLRAGSAVLGADPAGPGAAPGALFAGLQTDDGTGFAEAYVDAEGVIAGDGAATGETAAWLALDGDGFDFGQADAGDGFGDVALGGADGLALLAGAGPDVDLRLADAGGEGFALSADDGLAGAIPVWWAGFDEGLYYGAALV